MACFTRVEIRNLDEDALTQRARKNLGLPVTGEITQQHAATAGIPFYDIRRRVKVEAGVLKSWDTVRKVRPDALVRRKGNELVVTVTVG